eukprot:8610200-Prorocentrum_lima.AAC.1
MARVPGTKVATESLALSTLKLDETSRIRGDNRGDVPSKETCETTREDVPLETSPVSKVRRRQRPPC